MFSDIEPFVQKIAMSIEIGQKNLDIRSGEPNLVTVAIEDIPVTCLSLYAAKLRRFPTSSEVLMCSENTTGEL